ncbi:MAG TPA: STAS domain-containing protein [Pseudonocardia sp.]|jgi:anti-anti-sigma factor|nr:STAS domain-containing protein [Pseudonocardia sp.]
MTSTPSPYLRITSDVGTHTARLVLDGELDYETTPDLEAAVRELLSTRPGLRELRLDCGRIRFCDTIGLAGLLGVRRGADSAGMSLVLENRTATLDRLLELTGILRHLTSPLNVDGSTGYGGTGAVGTSRPG